jgi:glycosyltransferase involved in cell wall biosynthesis
MMISGFTIVRNASLLQYPFIESVESALPLCSEFIINCGDSTDNTLELCQLLKNKYPQKIQILRTTWQRENQTGGYQLKAQTDQCIQQCVGDYCLYIQADEVLHEEDYTPIKEALSTAAKSPEIDGVLFTYLHFYGNYDHTISGRNWYRKEVRLFKNNRGIESFRDAQGFRKNGERLLATPSNARVFHYGYVRTPDSLKTKSEAMAQWWGVKAKENPQAYILRNHVGIRRFKQTHPKVMTERLENNPVFDPKQAPRIWNKDEIKNALTFLWESVVPYRIGEFRNYELKK